MIVWRGDGGVIVWRDDGGRSGGMMGEVWSNCVGKGGGVE